jgi:uncharacterized protein (DUF1330 family)
MGAGQRQTKGDVDTMAAYIIAEVDVQDKEGFEEYRKRVPATLVPYGGRFLIRGGQTEVLEGDWTPKRVVVLEFPDFSRARDWWASQEYLEPKQMRQRAARTNLIVVDGYKPPV